MKLVVDANVIFSALIRKGMTRRLWFHPSASLIAPAYLIEEVKRHRKEILVKFRGTEEEFDMLFALLVGQLELVPDERLKPYLPAAASLSKDSDDWFYLACALCEDAALWSHDKGFLAQRRVRVLSSAELAGMLGLL
jgi:predicted nucleic acid-binding protein